jgi:hypothetical protein
MPALLLGAGMAFGSVVAGSIPLSQYPMAALLDTTGNMWISSNSNTMVRMADGTVLSTTAGLNLSVHSALDSVGSVWVTHNGANSVTKRRRTVRWWASIRDDRRRVAIDSVGNCGFAVRRPTTS